MNKYKRALRMVIQFLKEEETHGNVQDLELHHSIIKHLKEYEEWITTDEDEEPAVEAFLKIVNLCDSPYWDSDRRALVRDVAAAAHNKLKFEYGDE